MIHRHDRRRRQDVEAGRASVGLLRRAAHVARCPVMESPGRAGGIWRRGPLEGPVSRRSRADPMLDRSAVSLGTATLLRSILPPKGWSTMNDNRFPQVSNGYGLPGRAGGTPYGLARRMARGTSHVATMNRRCVSTATPASRTPPMEDRQGALARTTAWMRVPTSGWSRGRFDGQVVSVLAT